MRGYGVDCELYGFVHTFPGVGYGSLSTLRE